LKKNTGNTSFLRQELKSFVSTSGVKIRRLKLITYEEFWKHCGKSIYGHFYAVINVGGWKKNGKSRIGIDAGDSKIMQKE